jgi:hypothetical protein
MPHLGLILNLNGFLGAMNEIKLNHMSVFGQDLTVITLLGGLAELLYLLKIPGSVVSQQ